MTESAKAMKIASNFLEPEDNTSFVKKEPNTELGAKPSICHSVEVAFSAFLRLLLSQARCSTGTNPLTTWAIRILEQVLVRGRGRGRQLLLARALSSPSAAMRLFSVAPTMVTMR